MQPFRGEGDHQVLQEVVKGVFAPPSRVVRGYPFDLERILLRAMALQPMHRYPTMEQMRVALEEWLAKGGAVVTQSNVAQVVRERIGAGVEKRRERLKAAVLAIHERGGSLEPTEMAAFRSSAPPPMPGTPSGVKASASTFPPKAGTDDARGGGRTSYGMIPQLPPTPALPVVAEAAEPLGPRATSGMQYVIAASLGVIAAVSLGVGGVWAWRSTQPGPAPIAAASPGAPEVAPVVASPMSAAAAPPSTGPAAAALATVVFRVIPGTATLVVDGVALPLSVRAIARPTPGSLQKVTVHADGYEDQTLTIDETAPAAVDVWLNEPAGATRKAGAPRGGAEASGKPPDALPAFPPY